MIAVILNRSSPYLPRAASVFLFLITSAAANGALTAQLEQAIQEQVQSEQFVGLVLVHIDGDTRDVHSFGQISVDDNAVPTGSDDFEIGSITKVFTNLLLAELVAKGAVSYDTTIADILDDVSFENEAVGQITLSQLASHTSGLPRLPANLATTDPADPYADYGSDALLAGITSTRAGQELSKTYAYSNFGVGLLGYLMGLVDGQGYEAALSKHVLGPLGMDTATFTDGEALVPGHSGGQRVAHWHLQALSGAGALRASAVEMAKLFRPWLERGSIDFHHDVAGDLALVANAGRNINVTRVWHVIGDGEQRIYWHNGGTGGFRSFAGFNPVTRQGWVVLSNADADVTALGLRLLNAPQIQSTANSTSQGQGEPGAFADYSGHFAITPAFVLSVFESEGGLMVQATGQQALWLVPGGKDIFSLRDVDARLEFGRDAKGVVNSVTLYQNGQVMPAQRVEGPDTPAK